MERLTFYDDNGRVVSRRGYELALSKLAAYEDIGPTPEQLLEIDKMYSDMCREVAELKKQLKTKVEGDLISRKALEKAIRDYADEVGCNRGEYELANGILKSLSVVKNQSTAYDVEKVVEQLENYLFDKYCVEGDGKISEILKEGGVEEKGVL